MKILVPIDFSDCSRDALVEAVAWADQTGGSVVLLHVIPSANWHVLQDAKLRADLHTAAKEKAKKLSREVVGMLASTEIRAVEGTPHVEIVRFATAESIEAIVIGTHGWGAMHRFFLGSTTERVARTAECPVLVVRRSGSEVEGKRAAGPRHLQRILVATDFSDPADLAVTAAVRFAEMSGGELVLTHVLDDHDYPTYQVMSENRWSRVRRTAEAELLAVQQKACGEAVRSRVLLVDGVPSHQIIEAAKSNGADLVVVAPRSGEGHLLGATAERVVRGAPCSVYVAKRRADGRE